MHIYIDEAGSFLPPRNQPYSFSLVLALIIPSTIESELFYKFLRLRDKWPKQDIEIKGSKLNECQADELIKLVGRYDVLVEFLAIDMATHPLEFVAGFKCRQAEAIRESLTPAHNDDVVREFQSYSNAIRNMPNQLFLQAYLTIWLLFNVLRCAPLYFVQRQPKELGSFSWVIDRKDRTLTQMEETWAKLILPMTESYTARRPFDRLAGADYSYFERYEITHPDEEASQHIDWIMKTYGILGPTHKTRFFKSNLILTEQREFKGSRDSLGLQLADMLASILRRAFNNRLQPLGWMDFGSLLVRKAITPFVQIEYAGPIQLPPHAQAVWDELNSKTKSMLTAETLGE